MRYSPLTLSCLVLLAVPLHADQADDILQQTGSQGGLVVLLGCSDVDLIAQLHASDSYLVRALDTAPEKVDAARKSLAARGIYGPVSAAGFEGTRLPFVDGLVNLLVASDDRIHITADEITRVLAPGGKVLVRAALNPRPTCLEQQLTDLSGWTLYQKAVPAEMDQWGHYLHGADNNALSHDTIVGPPRHMQWLSGPRWTRHHHADKGTYPTIRAVVSAAGRLYYLLDETPSSNMKVPSRWALIARDGFSGVQLWRQSIRAETYPRKLEQVWRQIIADGDKIYVQLTSGEALSQLSGATGEVLQTYQGSEGFCEVIKDGPSLYFVGQRNELIAIDAETGQRRWSWDPENHGEIVPVTLAAATGRVFVKTATAACCLAADSGDEMWIRTLAQAKKNVRLSWPRERLIVADGVVLVSFGGGDPKVLNKDKDEFLGSHPRVREYGGRLAALDASTGKKLWETDYLPNLESAPGEIYVNKGVVWLGPAHAEARNLRTGNIEDGFAGMFERLWTDGHHYRCYPGKATSRYILTAKRGIELFDMQGEDHSRNNWIRATCRVGVTPCNGLIYASPHSCGCYMEAMLNGFWALASSNTRSAELQLGSANRLAPGPAYGIELQASDPTNAEPWPTYRGDNARSGNTATDVSADLREVWKANVGGRLTALTVADQKVFVAQVDQHTLQALDAEQGHKLWHFTTGGRIDSPPTFHRGLLLFGSRDGCVYCLRASDGDLVWRFRAAPSSEKAVAFEQLESLWPVFGSVLVEQGVAYVSAGRSSFLDGGIYLFGLDPATGEVLHERTLNSPHAGVLEPPGDAAARKSRNRQNWSDYKTTLAPDKSDSFSMEGALTDVMSAAGNSIFMRQMRFDHALVRQEEKGQHLFSTSSLLDGSEHHRSYWILGSGDFRNLPVAFPWIAGSSLQVPFGLTLAFDNETVWSVRGGAGRQRQAPDYLVVGSPRPDPVSDESALGDFEQRRSAATETVKKNVPLWQTKLTARPRAVLRAGKSLFVGGMKNADYKNALDDWQAGSINVLATNGGHSRSSIELAAPPVWGGMAAAGGKLYVSLESGEVVCLAE